MLMIQESLLNSECKQLADGRKVAVLTLNRPEVLNTLNLALVQMLKQQLIRWENDDEVCIILLRGAGKRAFCAGGDVKALYLNYITNEKEGVKSAQQFFDAEYQLDEMIASSLKPMIVYGHGYVLGGGLGLFQGANFRVLESSALIGVPETLIGLYPDVGCSYYLPRLKHGLGAFLGLTGIQISASNAQQAGWSNYVVASSGSDELLDALLAHRFDKNTSIYLQVDQVIQRLSVVEDKGVSIPAEILNWCEAYWRTPPKSTLELQVSLEGLKSVARGTSLEEKILLNLEYASPLSQWFTHCQLQLGRFLNLGEAFQAERVQSLACLTSGDFSEGVRALLLDKDRNPAWKYSSLKNIASSHSLVSPPISICSV